MKPAIFVVNHQDRVVVDPGMVERWQGRGVEAALRIARDHLLCDRETWDALMEVDVALVDDETSDRVHREFMNIPGATDVITFDHGEIVIGLEVARRQACEHGEPEEREVFRYLVHGLLHLAGYEDEEAEDRRRMESIQEALVAMLWTT
ncbi:MAG: rRNA maturation RNase YbeY [Verrucomicrobiales bacterium]